MNQTSSRHIPDPGSRFQTRMQKHVKHTAKRRGMHGCAPPHAYIILALLPCIQDYVCICISKCMFSESCLWKSPINFSLYWNALQKHDYVTYVPFYKNSNSLLSSLRSISSTFCHVSVTAFLGFFLENMSSWALGKHKNLNCKLGKYVEFFSKFKAKSELVEVVVAHRRLNHSHGVLEMVSIGSANPRIEGIF